MNEKTWKFTENTEGSSFKNGLEFRAQTFNLIIEY